MWSPATRNAVLAVACVTLAAFAAAPAAQRIVQWRLAQQHWRRSQRETKKHVPRETLRELQGSQARWVALCGTVFDVAGDAFFDAQTGGIYASWLHHDVAALLVYGGVIDGRPEHENESALLDKEIELQDVDPIRGDVAARRRLILDEWYARFHSRYEIVAHISDLYAGDEWEALRDQITPPSVDDADGQPRRRGKCPLGFGSSAVEQEEVEIGDEEVGSLREIRFQGRRYDVRGSALFDDALAHFVGHDITYALATQSNDPRDLDVVPSRQYSYEEQLRLEQYRRVFAKELRVISSPEGQSTKTETTAKVDLHQLIDQDTDVEEIRRALLDVAQESRDGELNAVCPRTTMTPLHKAVEKNRLELVQLLVQAGADIDAPAALYDDETALQMAQRFNYADIVSILTAHTRH